MGANIIVHSTTKFIGGHGTSIGGVIVDGGNFDWAGSGRFANFTEPDESYHGLVYADLGAPAFIFKARVQILRDIGACISPFNSFQFLQGLETLSLRMERHVQNAQGAAEFLEGHAGVTWVTYPGLKPPDYGAARKYLPKGPGPSWDLASGAAWKPGALYQQLEVVQPPGERGRRQEPGDPPRQHHPQPAQPGPAESAGVSPDFVRLSIGIEDIEDILWDLDQALAQAAQ
jgi:O-acetylhomoserine (thiol)-lyase